MSNNKSRIAARRAGGSRIYGWGEQGLQPNDLPPELQKEINDLYDMFGREQILEAIYRAKPTRAPTIQTRNKLKVHRELQIAINKLSETYDCSSFDSDHFDHKILLTALNRCRPPTPPAIQPEIAKLESEPVYGLKDIAIFNLKHHRK